MSCVKDLLILAGTKDFMSKTAKEEMINYPGYFYKRRKKSGSNFACEHARQRSLG